MTTTKTQNFEPQEAVPFGCVLTLPATGTEMNCGSVISWRRMNKKLGFKHDLVFPAFSVLDPEATYSLPKKQVANGLADAFVHVVEQYMASFDIGIVQDEQSEAIMRSLIHVAHDTLKDDPPIYKARADFFWATTQALNGLIGLGVPQCWATHMIGHELSSRSLSFSPFISSSSSSSSDFQTPQNNNNNKKKKQTHSILWP